MKPLTVEDTIAWMEKIAPPHLAEDWDNVGLQIGNKKWPVKKIWVALEPSCMVIQQAARAKVDLLITHHPLFFRPYKIIDLGTTEGKIIEICVRNQLSVYSAHTNFDSVDGGLNDILAEKLSLQSCSILDRPVPLKKIKLVVYSDKINSNRIIELLHENQAKNLLQNPIHNINGLEKKESLGEYCKPASHRSAENSFEFSGSKIEAVVNESELEKIILGLKQKWGSTDFAYEVYPLMDQPSCHGIGRIATLKKKQTLHELALTVKNKLEIPAVRIVGDPGLLISSVAVCTGSGAGLLNRFLTSGAQVYVTGDIKYHDAMTVVQAGKGMIDVGHFASEQIMVEVLVKKIKKYAEKVAPLPITIEACHGEQDPISILS